MEEVLRVTKAVAKNLLGAFLLWLCLFGITYFLKTTIMSP